LKYPIVTSHALNRTLECHHRTTPMFKFKLSWLFKEGFYEMVTELWQKEQRLDSDRSIAKTKFDN
jgi:hypothetical protein